MKMIYIKLLIENKLVICALGNLLYMISKEKFEIRRSEVRIPVLVQIFLLRSYKMVYICFLNSLDDYNFIFRQVDVKPTVVWQALSFNWLIKSPVRHFKLSTDVNFFPSWICYDSFFETIIIFINIIVTIIIIIIIIIIMHING